MMSFASSKTDINSQHSLTPSGYSKNTLKLPARKLWQHDQIDNGRWTNYRNSEVEQWDQIHSPQFVDFANLKEMGDSFFGKSRVIVSTPIPNVNNGSSVRSFNDNTVIQSLKGFSLSGVDLVSPKKDEHNIREQSMNQSVANDTVIRVETNGSEECKEVKKPLNIAKSPFRFHGRDKCKQDKKSEEVKKNLEEGEKVRMFRANPLPKYLKARKMEINENNKNNNNNVMKMDHNGIDKEQKLQSSDKNKKNTEIWKKPPFVPCPAQKNFKRPKTPPLRTAIRAQERKRFDKNLKVKEMQFQQQRQMELAAKKMQEEKEIALLRKQTVHKAQPIRKYKSSLPEIKKRPLTDPQSPITLKRRRIGTL